MTQQAKCNEFLDVPQELWAARDAAIDFALNGGPTPKSLKQLEKWFSQDPGVWENLHSETAAMQFDPALHVTSGALSRACESELRHEFGLDEGTVITDAMRIDYTRQVLSEELHLESEDLAGIAHRWIENGNGKRCLIGYIEEWQGQGGIQCLWEGVFSDEGAWEAHLSQKGYLRVTDIDDAPDDALLKLFDKDG